jgi:hypothetical protein
MRSGVTVMRAFARARPTTRMASGRQPQIRASLSACRGEHPGAARHNSSVYQRMHPDNIVSTRSSAIEVKYI